MSQLPSILRWPLLLSVVLAGQLMVFSLGLNLSPLEPFSTPYWILHGVLMASTAAVLLLLGWDLLKSTFREITAGRITIEAMFTLSALGAAVVSLRSTLSGQGPIFYEVVAIVLCIYTVGKQIGSYAKHKVLAQIETLRDHLRFGWLKIDDHFSWADLTSLKIGDQIKVETGKIIPVDGRVISGEAFVAEATLTGEPLPRACKPGDTVFAGSTPIDGELILEATQPYGQRLIDGVFQTLETAECLPSRLQVRSDRWMQLFVPFVVCLSFVTFMLWFLPHGAAEGILNSMSVLLVACPCALGLATPIAVWSALWNLSQKGIWIKTGTALDTIAQSTTWVFDKTGTLSYGDVHLKSWQWSPTSPAAEIVRSACKALQSEIDHPIARAFCVEETLTAPVAIEVLARQWHPGKGVEGSLKVGNEVVALKIERSKTAHSTPAIAIEWNDEIVAEVTWEETFREDVATVFRDLQSKGCKIFVLTGDASKRFENISGAKVLSGQSPLDKIQFMKKLKEEREITVFVGDGVNDAAAMTEAHLGIAMQDGASLTQTVAQVLLKSQKLSPLVLAHGVARNVQKGIDSNMALSLGYNLIGIGFATTGYLHPVVAALIMTASSTIVCIRAIRSAKLLEDLPLTRA